MKTYAWWICCILLCSNRRLLVNGKVACMTTEDCTRDLREGSICNVDGFCSNPFQQGCLKTLLGDDFKTRICSSHDAKDAAEEGICRPSPFDYMEIRISPQNWESAIFYAWIMQIILSEMVDVPVSIDNGVGGGKSSFYDPDNSFAYNKVANNFEGIYKANEVGDCRKVNTTAETCAHVLPELWQGNRDVDETKFERDGNGMVGYVGWFVPKHVVEEHPALASHWGLRDEKHRSLLAELFRRPTTWKDYCEEVSETKCLNDTVAVRPPELGGDSKEGEKYFVEGLYEGHFRLTEKNNCTATENCTGHIVDYPCTWSAYTQSQLYWNKIPLESDKQYSYSSMIQIMKASKATKAPVMFVWWYPDSIIEQYDFFQIQMTEATQECLMNRPDIKPNRCNATWEQLIGSEIGSCGYNAHSFETIYAASLRKSNNAPEAIRSPAYQTLRNMRISDISISEIMKDWIERGIDTYGYDPREAVCQWVAKRVSDEENVKYNPMRFIPAGYPREIERPSYSGVPSLIAAQVFASVVIVLTLVTSAAVVYYREATVMKRAQMHFLFQFCFGFLIVLIGAILHTLVPSDASCITRYWFVTIGYTQGLVPLLIKVGAINRVMNEAKKMRRFSITRTYLYMWQLLATTAIVIYFIIWTVLDPPSKTEEMVLVSENVVEVSLECESKSDTWLLIAFLWETIYIICAAVLAFQTRKITKDFNESKEIGNMAYAHFLFLMCRLVLRFLPPDMIRANTQQAIYSVVLSADVLFALGMYFGPKIKRARKWKALGDQPICEISGLDSSARKSARSNSFIKSANFLDFSNQTTTSTGGNGNTNKSAADGSVTFASNIEDNDESP